MKISIETIPHEKQRYDTVGDWWFEGDTLNIRVSDMGNTSYEFLVARHELDEAFLCLKEGVSERAVTEFDIRFEDMRKQFPEIVKDREPGWDRSAPYRSQHKFATKGEVDMAKRLGVDWNDYDKKVNSL